MRKVMRWRIANSKAIVNVACGGVCLSVDPVVARQLYHSSHNPQAISRSSVCWHPLDWLKLLSQQMTGVVREMCLP